MATATLTDLRRKVRERADMVNSSFISATELDGYINASAYELFDLLVESNEDYNTLSTNSTIASGSHTIALPALAYKIRGVDVSYDNGQTWCPLKPYSFVDRGNYSDHTLTRRYANVRYRIIGSTLHLLPESEAPGLYRIWYVPTMTPLVNAGDTFEAYNGFEEYIVIDAAIKCLVKEESDTAPHERAKKAIKDRIIAMAASRDMGGPETIADVERYADNLW